MVDTKVFGVEVHRIFIVGAAYGILQVLAQDLGIKTGKRQRDLVQSQPVQGFLMLSGAYLITNDLTLAMWAVAIYYFLKYVYSGGETSTVCFEEV